MQSEIYSVGVLCTSWSRVHIHLKERRVTAIGKLHDRHSPPTPLRDVRPDLPDPFIRVIVRALAEDPSQRFASAGAMEAALAQLLGPVTEPSPTPTLSLKLLLAAFALLVLAVGSLTVSQLRGPSPTSGPGASGRAETPPATQASSTTPSAASPTSEYRIDAAFYR